MQKSAPCAPLVQLIWGVDFLGSRVFLEILQQKKFCLACPQAFTLVQGSHSALTAQHISLKTEHRDLTKEHESLRLASAEQSTQHQDLLKAHQQLTQQQDATQAKLDASIHREAAAAAAHEQLQRQHEQLEEAKATQGNALAATQERLAAVNSDKVCVGLVTRLSPSTEVVLLLLLHDDRHPVTSSC